MRAPDHPLEKAALCRRQAKRTLNPDVANVLQMLAEHYEAEAKRI